MGVKRKEERSEKKKESRIHSFCFHFFFFFFLTSLCCRIVADNYFVECITVRSSVGVFDSLVRARFGSSGEIKTRFASSVPSRKRDEKFENINNITSPINKTKPPSFPPNQEA